LRGPLPFVEAVPESLLERAVRPEDVEYEVFGPDPWQADLLTEPAHGMRR
jgi:nitric oxide dioxygenase